MTITKVLPSPVGMSHCSGHRPAMIAAKKRDCHSNGSCPVQLNKEGEVRESSAILFDADISMRIILSEDSHTNATIVFDKVRQGQRSKSLPIEIEGWFQTISGKISPEDVPNPEDL
jgi:hypothetical protein